MRNHTDSLSLGSPAPPFALTAANRDGSFALAELISCGLLIVEFLRGTW
jgi:hypothetical protein